MTENMPAGLLFYNPDALRKVKIGLEFFFREDVYQSLKNLYGDVSKILEQKYGVSVTAEQPRSFKYEGIDNKDIEYKYIEIVLAPQTLDSILEKISNYFRNSKLSSYDTGSKLEAKGGYDLIALYEEAEYQEFFPEEVLILRIKKEERRVLREVVLPKAFIHVTLSEPVDEFFSKELIKHLPLLGASLFGRLTLDLCYNKKVSRYLEHYETIIKWMKEDEDDNSVDGPDEEFFIVSDEAASDLLSEKYGLGQYFLNSPIISEYRNLLAYRAILITGLTQLLIASTLAGPVFVNNGRYTTIPYNFIEVAVRGLLYEARGIPLGIFATRDVLILSTDFEIPLLSLLIQKPHLYTILDCVFFDCGRSLTVLFETLERENKIGDNTYLFPAPVYLASKFFDLSRASLPLQKALRILTGTAVFPFSALQFIMLKNMSKKEQYKEKELASLWNQTTIIVESDESA